MARILYAWELGTGLGHAHRLVQLAGQSQLAAHHAVFAVPEHSKSEAYLQALGKDCRRGPQAVPAHAADSPAGRAFRAGTYADILAWHGYAQADTLRRQVEGWRAVLKDSGADLVIADSAPSLLLAARGRVPAIAVGNGFTTPPHHLPEFPPIPSPGDGQPAGQLLSQARMCELVGSVLADDSAPSATLPGWFSSVDSVPLAYPQLDPYDGLRARPACGPAHWIDGPLPIAPKTHVFAYLAAEYPALEQVLDALEGLDVTVSVTVRGADSALTARLQQRRFALQATPFKLPDIMHRSSLVVHHAAANTSHAVLDAGRAQMVLPFHLENTLMAQRLLKLRVAVGAGYRECHKLPALLAHALNDTALSQRAGDIARQLRETEWSGADRVADAARPWLT